MNVMTAATQLMTATTQLMVAKKHNEYRTLRSKIFFKDSDNKFNSYFLETVNDINVFRALSDFDIIGLCEYKDEDGEHVEEVAYLKQFIRMNESENLVEDLIDIRNQMSDITPYTQIYADLFDFILKTTEELPLPSVDKERVYFAPRLHLSSDYKPGIILGQVDMRDGEVAMENIIAYLNREHVDYKTILCLSLDDYNALTKQLNEYISDMDYDVELHNTETIVVTPEQFKPQEGLTSSMMFSF